MTNYTFDLSARHDGHILDFLSSGKRRIAGTREIATEKSLVTSCLYTRTFTSPGSRINDAPQRSIVRLEVISKNGKRGRTVNIRVQICLCIFFMLICHLLDMYVFLIPKPHSMHVNSAFCFPRVALAGSLSLGLVPLIFH